MTNVLEYIREFEDRCVELANTKLEQAPKPEEIIKEVDEMIEQYYKVVGRFPKPRVLELLSNYILVNELKDKDVDKISNNDFPIMSETQLKRRGRKQTPMKDTTLDFLNTKFNKHIDSLSKKGTKKVDY